MRQGRDLASLVPRQHAKVVVPKSRILKGNFKHFVLFLPIILNVVLPGWFASPLVVCVHHEVAGQVVAALLASPVVAEWINQYQNVIQGCPSGSEPGLG